MADWMSRSVPDPVRDQKIEDIAAPVHMVTSESPLRVPTTIPPVPQPEHLKKCYATITEEEMNDTYTNNDGIRYSIHTNRLFIPTPLRETIAFWFHTSRFG